LSSLSQFIAWTTGCAFGRPFWKVEQPLEFAPGFILPSSGSFLLNWKDQRGLDQLVLDGIVCKEQSDVEDDFVSLSLAEEVAEVATS
jgi:hypothetical protein